MTLNKEACQGKVSEVFTRFTALLEEIAPRITRDEVGEAAYILKLFSDFCEIGEFDLPGERPQKIAGPDEIRNRVAQDLVYAMQARAGELEPQIKPRLSPEQSAEVDAVHALMGEVATGCGYKLASGGGGK